jgi:hypothetical protein
MGRQCSRRGIRRTGREPGCAVPIQRCFQGIRVITQHTQGRLARYESVGQFFLGLEPDATWF